MSGLVRKVESPEVRNSLLNNVIFSSLVVLLLLGCGEERENTPLQKPGAVQVGFRPDQFPDIPLPRAGYMTDPAYDQLAMAVAGGAVRRFEVALIQRENAQPQSGAELLAWYQRDLGAAGWTLAEDGAETQVWHKGSEHLRLETGRSGSRTTIRLRLRPAR